LEPAWCDKIAVFCHMESSSASALQYSKITTADRTVVALQLTYSPTHLLLMKSNISKPFARNLLFRNT
jgi:hypothetical protein